MRVACGNFVGMYRFVCFILVGQNCVAHSAFWKWHCGVCMFVSGVWGGAPEVFILRRFTHRTVLKHISIDCARRILPDPQLSAKSEKGGSGLRGPTFFNFLRIFSGSIFIEEKKEQNFQGSIRAPSKTARLQVLMRLATIFDEPGYNF